MLCLCAAQLINFEFKLTSDEKTQAAITGIDLPTSRAQIFSQARSPSGRCFFMFSAEKASEKAKASRWGQLPELKMISDGL